MDGADGDAYVGDRWVVWWGPCGLSPQWVVWWGVWWEWNWFDSRPQAVSHNVFLLKVEGADDGIFLGPPAWIAFVENPFPVFGQVGRQFEKSELFWFVMA